ncbi:MAG: response regulator [Deltaproteobacteria bacterium]|nr:response regulator [Deltaproteobacteria bacterium]
MRNIFHSFKISEKIAVVFLFLLFMMGIGGMVGLYNAREIATLTTELYTNFFIRQDTLKTVEKELLTTRQEAYFYVVSNDKSSKEYLKRSMVEHDKKIKETLAEHLRAEIGKQGALEAALFTSFQKEWLEYITVRDEAIKLAYQDNADVKALAMLTNEGTTKFKTAMDTLQALIAEAKDSSSSEYSRAGYLSRIITWATIGATILAIILATGLWYMLSRSIVKPIEALERSAKRIAGGNLKERVAVASKDEIGELAAEFNSMVEHIEYYYATLEKRVEERTDTIKAANEELFRKKQEVEILNEELVKANKMKSQFLANVSHELRTPLNSIMGFSELLTEKSFGELNEKQAQYVNYIFTSGGHLLHLINNILDLSKIEAGRLELFLEEFPLEDVLSEVLGNIRPQADKKDIRIESKTTPVSPIVKLDRPKFKQVMFNLLSNAVKFNRKNGKITLDWDIREEFKDAIKERSLHVSVKDTGIGIKDEDMPKMFEEFVQIDPSITREYGGTGLGLALTKKLVELHKGRIWVESEYGKGAAFNFVIPQEAQSIERETAHIKHIQPFQQPGPESSTAILVASEGKNLNELIKVYLMQNGYAVDVAADGIEVLEKARQTQPFAIIMGITLPKKDGWEVLKELKASPDTCDIPVVIVSAANNKELGFSLGAVDYLVKPVNKEKLISALGRLSFMTKVKRHPFSILAIDDEPQVLELLNDILEKEGFGVLKAANGEEGIALAIERDPDLIILDLMMPQVSGFDVLEQLKKHPTAKDIPILIFTAKDITSDDKAKLGDNIANILKKAHFSKHNLLNEIKKLELAYPARAKMIDPLTGIFNHRYFNHWIAQEIARSKRYGLHFAMMMIDVDNLQGYNTKDGFLLGNEALVELARLIENNIRKADCVIRYGGDEFLVVLPNIKKEAAAIVAEKLRIRAGNHAFPSSDGRRNAKISISIGVAGFPVDGREQNELMLNISQAVQSAFRSGGNKVSLFKKS